MDSLGGDTASVVLILTDGAIGDQAATINEVSKQLNYTEPNECINVY